MNAASARIGHGGTAAAGKANHGPDIRRAAQHPLDLLLFVVIAAVLCARPLIPETMERVAFSFLPAEAGGGPTPGTSIILDFVLLLASLIVWIRRHDAPFRLSVWTAGFALLLVAVVVSVCAANDKRAAANAGSELFVIALAGAALARLMNRRWMMRVLLAALIAAGATNAVKCVTQNAWEFSDTLADWQTRKPQLIAAGFDPNSPTIVNFERRMQSTESFGYLSHPNVAASCIAMSFLCAGGLLLALLRARDAEAGSRLAAALVAAVLAALLGAGIWLTGSLGAQLGVAGAAALLLAIGLMKNWLAPRARSVFLILLGSYVAVVAIGAGYGLSKGTLPNASLAFRWEYWRAAIQGYRAAALTGVGGDNFRSVYLLHKSPESAEELSNPHNLWLTMLVELGPVGLLAALLLVGGAAYAAVAACRPRVEPSKRAVGQVADPPARSMPRATIIALVAAVPLTQAAATGLPFGAPADVFPAILLLWLVSLAGVWAAAAAVCFSLVKQVDTTTVGPNWIAAGMLAGLCATLVHNLIGFSMLTPAGLSMFAALAACAFAARASDQTPQAQQSLRGRRMTAVLSISVGIALVAAHLNLVVAPAIRGDAAAERVAQLSHATDSAALAAAATCERELHAIDRWDALLLAQLGRVALSRAQAPASTEAARASWIDLAERNVSEAVKRVPHRFGAERLRAEIFDLRAVSSDDVGLLTSAANQWDIAIATYPTDPRARIGGGLAWTRVWNQTGSRDDAERANEHFSAAIAIDATRDTGNASKLRRSERLVIEDALTALGTD